MLGRFGLTIVFAAGCGGGSDTGSDTGSGEVELEAACGASEDEGIDGTVDVTWVHELDGAGQIVERDGDRDGDGVPEEVYTYEWNADGRPLSEEGPVLGYDHRRRHEYQWDGVNATEGRFLYDSGAGFELVQRWTSTYSDGAEVEEVFDWDDDGDLVTAGRLEMVETDSDGDGQIDVRETFEYEEGRIVRSTSVQNVDQFGEQTFYMTWTYDGGALAEVVGFVSVAPPPDAIPDYRSYWTLDDAQRVIEHGQAWLRGGRNVTKTARDARGLPLEVTTDYFNGYDPDVERMEYDGDRMIRDEVRSSSETTEYQYQFDCGG